VERLNVTGTEPVCAGLGHANPLIAHGARKSPRLFFRPWLIGSPEGPEVRSGPLQLTALNIPPESPARDMQDTFYLSESTLLRTHNLTRFRSARLRARPRRADRGSGRVLPARCGDATHRVVSTSGGVGRLMKSGFPAICAAPSPLFCSSSSGICRWRFRASYCPFTNVGLRWMCSGAGVGLEVMGLRQWSISRGSKDGLDPFERLERFRRRPWCRALLHGPPRQSMTSGVLYSSDLRFSSSSEAVASGRPINSTLLACDRACVGLNSQRWH